MLLPSIKYRALIVICAMAAISTSCGKKQKDINPRLVCMNEKVPADDTSVKVRFMNNESCSVRDNSIYIDNVKVASYEDSDSISINGLYGSKIFELGKDLSITNRKVNLITGAVKYTVDKDSSTYRVDKNRIKLGGKTVYKFKNSKVMRTSDCNLSLLEASALFLNNNIDERLTVKTITEHS